MLDVGCVTLVFINRNYVYYIMLCVIHYYHRYNIIIIIYLFCKIA